MLKPSKLNFCFVVFFALAIILYIYFLLLFFTVRPSFCLDKLIMFCVAFGYVGTSKYIYAYGMIIIMIKLRKRLFINRQAQNGAEKKLSHYLVNLMVCTDRNANFAWGRLTISDNFIISIILIVLCSFFSVFRAILIRIFYNHLLLRIEMETQFSLERNCKKMKSIIRIIYSLRLLWSMKSKRIKSSENCWLNYSSEHQRACQLLTLTESIRSERHVQTMGKIYV